MKKDNPIDPYIYDTPLGVVEKQGMMYRGMADPKGKPLWIRAVSIVIGIMALILPGIFILIFAGISFSYEIARETFWSWYSLSYLIALILPLIMVAAGAYVCFKNIRGR